MVAEVRVNGVDCGVVWAPPYVVDVSQGSAFRPNQIEIIVWQHGRERGSPTTSGSLPSMVADSERRYGRRFRMQELDRAMDGIRSGLLACPALVISTDGWTCRRRGWIAGG